MMYIAITGAESVRTVNIRKVSRSTLNFDVEDVLSTINILDYSRSYHSVENLLPYYPNFTSPFNVNSYTAIQQGRPFIQALVTTFMSSAVLII